MWLEGVTVNSQPGGTSARRLIAGIISRISIVILLKNAIL